ncbi:hypothetical protein FXO38_06209 [Capsicum annuum]|uniref:UBE2O-like SH3-B domain-containing protein n=1 Tax=Capsicum annuum TaxID=4072 RepID=A0A2G2ZJG7_CAPAN|nr:hypothetical protein FXO37_33675 [Capsicum annuum]KAF3672231.1 hypothetical protein FXO38_06209 [Capsicum annuum]PHT82116.1 hypothetical protein T459_15131 [Capsicum annuum]
MESEFITLDKVSEEEEWLWNFLEDIPYWPKPVAPICIHCDSQAAIGRARGMMYNVRPEIRDASHRRCCSLSSASVSDLDLDLDLMEEYLLDDSYSDSFVHNDTVVLRTDTTEHDLPVEETSFLIVKTRTSLDIMWQDGSIERYIDSTSVMPFEVLGDQEFFPEQLVSEKYLNDVGSSHVGVVKNANSKERIATIRWVNQNTTVGEPISFEMEELASMYNLKLHTPLNNCYGNIVTRLEANESEVLDLSWVGNITGFKDGEVEVNGPIK